MLERNDGLTSSVNTYLMVSLGPTNGNRSAVGIFQDFDFEDGSKRDVQTPLRRFWVLRLEILPCLTPRTI